MVKTKTFFLFFALLIVSNLRCFGQDPQLFNHPWILFNVTIDGVDYDPTLMGELLFSTDNISAGHPFCEDYFGTPIFYDNMDVFNLDDNPVFLLGSCSDPVYTDFMEKHYSIYFLDGQFAKNPFNYALNTNGNGTIVLTVTNNEGNQAVYTDPFLSTIDLTSVDISFHPNPVDDLLYFYSKNNTILSIGIFNLLGKKVSQFDLHNEKGIDQVSLANLDSGIYFLKIYTVKGLTTKRIIKR